MNPLNLKSKLVYGKGGPLTREPDTSRYNDIDEPMAGKCMTCKTIVSCLRSQAVARTPKYGEAFPEPGTWADLLSTECPNCKARVFVMNAKEFRAVVERS
jgi:DNA-directed RNA polymerase subunit RPC12/RpoP